MTTSKGGGFLIYIKDSKFRGEALFTILLSLGNEFGCHNGDPEELNKYSYWAYNLNKMILNINDLEPNRYSSKMFSKRKVFDNYTDDNCGEYLSRASYQILIEAWEAGIINLKDFGEK